MSRKKQYMKHQNKNRIVYLIGFMGAGKSAVSRCLSEITGLPLMEMDQEIEKEAGCSIQEIFAVEGEECFRQRENALLKMIGTGEPRIVSCGGGAVLREENVRIMRETGTVILLTASPETIYGRVRHSRRRPLLNGHMEIPYIRGLMDKRKQYYEAAAEYSVATDGKSPREIAEEILTILGGGKEKD